MILILGYYVYIDVDSVEMYAYDIEERRGKCLPVRNMYDRKANPINPVSVAMGGVDTVIV